MIHILYISHYLRRNGTEAFMMNLYRGLDRDRYRADFLILTDEETDYSREIEARGDKVYHLPARKNGYGQYCRRLSQFFHEHGKEYDAVHWCGGNLSSIMPIRMAARNGVALRIIHAHNSSCEGLHNHILHRLHTLPARRLATHVLACSEKAALFFGNKTATIIRNGIETQRYRYNPVMRTEVRKELGIAEEEIVIGHVGRFTVVKNHRKLLGIVKAMLMRQIKVKLLLIGEGETEQAVDAQAKKLGIENSIYRIGVTAQVYRYMQAMDVFVMPSLFEGLPFVLVEAQSAGLPCVLSDTIPADSKINDNVRFVALQATDDIWADAVLSQLQEPRTDRADNVKAAGYDIQTTIQQLETIYAAPNRRP